MSQARTTIVSPLRAATYDTLVGLLAATGLRIGEAIKLDRSDVDWDQAVLLIRESKFGKSRLVPLHASTMQALTEFAVLREQLQPRPKVPSFFVSLTRDRLSYAVVSQTFRQLVDGAGVGAEAPSPPRLHDLRHTFAVHTLLGWYRSAEDVQAKIPAVDLPRAPRTILDLLVPVRCPGTARAGRRPPRHGMVGGGHDPDRGDAAIVLHRPARPATSGQPRTIAAYRDPCGCC